MRKYVETLHKVTSYSLHRREKLNGEESYHLQDTMASESYKLQIKNSCVTSIMRKSTMEWQGLEHALECLILTFDVKSLTWTLKRPCAQ